MQEHRLRLVLYRGRLLWGNNAGLLLPEWLAQRVCRAWNRVACRVLGHDDTLWHLHVGGYLPEDEPLHCVHCCATLTGCTGHKGEVR